MTYSRGCGVSLAACGDKPCRCVPVDPGPVIAREEPAQRCEHCWHPVSEHYGRWCRHVTGAINASGAQRICCCEGADSESSGGLQITNNPIQRTYDESRADA